MLLLGVGGLAMILVPTLGAIYAGRYMVPSAGLLASAAAIAAMSLWEATKRPPRRQV